MCTVVKIMLHSVCAECAHIYAKHKSVTQPHRTVVKIICTRTRICTKAFRDIVSNWINTKICYNSNHFVDQTIHWKIKWMILAESYVKMMACFMLKGLMKNLIIIVKGINLYIKHCFSWLWTSNWLQFKCGFWSLLGAFSSKHA